MVAEIGLNGQQLLLMRTPKPAKNQPGKQETLIYSKKKKKFKKVKGVISKIQETSVFPSGEEKSLGIEWDKGLMAGLYEAILIK